MNTLTAAKAATAGRGWAYVGAVLGGGFSVAANVAHSYIPPVGAPADWSPMAGKVIESIIWPVLLFVAVEILSRVAWPKGFWHGALRFGGMVPVGFVAALVSYRHLSALLMYYGEDAWTNRMGPLAVDGIMLISTGALIVTGKRRLALVEDAPATPEATPAPVPNLLDWSADRVAELRERLGDAPATPEPAQAAATAAPAWAETGTTSLPQYRRSAAETRRLFEAMKEDDPTTTQQQAADRLGIARRTLRDALAATPDPTAEEEAAA